MASNERGMTLIELLVVIVVLGSLAGMSLMTFKTYKQLAYHNAADTLVHDIYTSLEAGQSAADQLGQNWYWAWAPGDGTIIGRSVSLFLPGIRVKEHERLWVSYDGWCDSATGAAWCAPGAACCVVNMIQAYDCRAETVTNYARWNNGTITQIQWRNMMGC